jgi:hypothetical protein
MNDEKTPTAAPGDGQPVTSENIEIPEIPQAGQWVMPKPVFRQSSGRLPQGFEKRFAQAETAVVSAPSSYGGTAPALAVEPPVAALPTEVAPQPDVAEEIVYTAPEPDAAVKTRSAAMRITLIVLGLLAMVAFVVAFLAVVYFLFLSSPNESQVLN